jgi:hypothetical protein
MALGAHAAGVLAAGTLASAGLAPWLATAALLALTARAAHGLSRFRRPARPRTVGFQEMAWGIGFACALAAGYRWSL